MKKAFSLIAFIILTGCLVFGSYKILSWKDTSGPYLSSAQQLYSTGSNLIDAAFVGSSHCYCGVYPEVIWEEYGYSGFNMAVSGQDKDSACHGLIELCKTQKPKIVFVDLFALSFERQAVESNAYRNMLAMRPSLNSVKLVLDYAGEEERLDYILRWPIIHTRYRELGKYDFVDYEPSNFGRGALLNWEVGPPQKPFSYGYTLEEELSEENRAWLEELQELSKEYGFELVTMVLPYYFDEKNQMILNGAKAYLKEREIPVLDFNLLAEEIQLDYTKDFLDYGHLNAYGAKKVSRYLGDYLKETKLLADHRGDSRYAVWDRSTLYFNQSEQEQQLKQIQDIQEWQSKVSGMQNLTFVFSLDGAYGQSELDLCGLLEAFGIAEAEACSGGTWIVKTDGTVVSYGYEQREPLLWDLGDDTLKITNRFHEDGTHEDVSILLGREEYGIVTDGLNILVFDEIQKKLLEWRGFY